MSSEFAVRLEGWTELQRAFRSIDKRLPKELQLELKAAADVVKSAAEQIAEEKGLAPPGSSGRGEGGLIAGLRTFSTQKAAGVRDSANRDGFNYPAIYEYGHGKSRAFLHPAAEQKEAVVDGMVGQMLDRLTSSEGLGRGGIL